MNLLMLLSKIKHSPKMAFLRKYTNLLYYDPEYVTLKVSNFDIIEVDGCKWHMSDQLNMNQRVIGNPWFEGIRNTDTVVDIGANIGAIAIPLAKTAKKVYAVEPLYADELKNNVELNNLKNVQIFECGVGEDKEIEIEFWDRKKVVPLMTFEELKRIVGRQIDFLKIDGEGCEWDIAPSEFKGVREIRMEFHLPRGKIKEYRKRFNEYIDWMENNKYEVHVSYVNIGPNPYFVEYPEVRASLK